MVSRFLCIWYWKMCVWNLEECWAMYIVFVHCTMYTRLGGDQLTGGNVRSLVGMKVGWMISSGFMGNLKLSPTDPTDRGNY